MNPHPFIQVNITGDYSKDPSGITPPALDPATSFPFICGLIERAVAAGAKAVMLSLWQGCPQGQTYDSAITWSAFNPVLRDTARKLGSWMAMEHPGVGMAIYTGSWISHTYPRDNTVDAGYERQLDFTDPLQCTFAESEWLPWASAVRAKWIGVDYSGAYADGGKALAEAMKVHGLGVLLEGTPWVRTPIAGPREIYTDAMKGSDTNSGTVDAPLKTLQQAMRTIYPTVDIRPGPIPTMGLYPDLLVNDPADTIHCRAGEWHGLLIWNTHRNLKGELLGDADFKHLRGRGWHLCPLIDAGTDVAWAKNVLAWNGR